MLLVLYWRDLCLVQVHRYFLLEVIDIYSMLIHFLSNSCIWYKVWIQVHLFAYRHPKHFLNICWKDSHFSVALLSTFARNQLSIDECVCFGLSILKIQWHLCKSLCHCPDDCNVVMIVGSFAMLFWSFLVLHNSIGVLWSVCQFLQKLFWDVAQNCMDSIDQVGKDLHLNNIEPWAQCLPVRSDQIIESIPSPLGTDLRSLHNQHSLLLRPHSTC